MKGKKRLKEMWKKQDGKCLVCRDKINKKSGWRVHAADDGKYIVHPSCHDKIHSQPLLDTSKRIELVVWFAGDPAPDAGSVIEELNKKLLEDFNCTMKINHLGWADYETRYSLLLNAKEECDIVL
jgi:hypothetical protein